MKYLIVGIDPGTKTGIALIDLEGNILCLFSSKDMGLNNTIEYITSKGRPTIIASDVTPEPRFVSNVASKLGCPSFVPSEPLSVEEKNKMTKGYDVVDFHQRDPPKPGPGTSFSH